jgi:TPR repeat protein
MVRRIWLVGALLGAVAAPLPAQSVKAGIEAWQRADYAAAVAIWRPLAEKGDADAAFNLGQAYRLGRGVPTNLGAAQTWFERAANKGHVDAQATLGLLLFQNGSQPEGLKWLKAAAEQGEPRALLVYGTALFNGDSVAQDPILGYAYISRAAAQGLAPAKDTLAQLDKLLPLEDRKKGLALAMAKAKAAPPPGSKTAKATKSAAKPVKNGEAKPAKPAPPAAEPKAALAPAPASGNWRIQLGAFSQRGSAEALYKKVAGSAVLAGRQPYYVPAGAVTRLQVGPFASRAAAQAACSALKQACFPVPMK